MLLAFGAVLVGFLSFAVGLFSGVYRNGLFDVAFAAKSALLPPEPDGPPGAVELDLSDRGLVDSTLLPLRRTDFVITDEEGAPVALAAVVAGEGGEAIVLDQQGRLFRLAGPGCTGADCITRIGRLLRPDGATMDDSYDMVSVAGADGIAFYVAYGREDSDGAFKRLAVSRFALPADAGAETEVTLDAPLFETRKFSLANGHAWRSAGGAMVHDPRDDSLVVTVGDFSINGFANAYEGPVPPAQSDDSDLGKILRIDRATGSATVLSKGHRNPQGLALSEGGELVSTEHALKGGDEINAIAPGGNYGWPYVSLGAVYGTYAFPQKPRDPDAVHGGYVPPVVAYLPSPGIGAAIFVEDFQPAWDGDLLVATLKARSLMRVRRWDTGNYTEQIYMGERIRDLEIVAGRLVLATDSGKIVVLVPVENPELALTETGLNTNLNAVSTCGSCHNLNYPVSTEYAPHLRDVAGRRIASADDYDGYSDALLARGDEDWTIDTLESYLRSPQDFAPGTTMPDPELSEADLAEILGSLALLR